MCFKLLAISFAVQGIRFYIVFTMGVCGAVNTFFMLIIFTCFVKLFRMVWMFSIFGGRSYKNPTWYHI